MGNFDDARRLLRLDDKRPMCPGCQEQRLVEQVGLQYLCAVCSRVWPAPRPEPQIAAPR